jgi:phosphatidylinositol alpha-1,6-mannosyltransferase
VDLPTEPAGSYAADQSQASTVITVARLENRYKGFDVMIAAMPLVRARVPDVRWVLVGEGSLAAELEATARAVGVGDAITFTGAVSDSERNRLLSRAAVFAMPSRLVVSNGGGEGFGIVFLEASARGLPCVAGNVGGAVDAVVNGKTGITVDPTDHVAVAEAISTLLLDPRLRAQLGEAGRARAAEFSWDRMAEQVDDLVERSVAASRL